MSEGLGAAIVSWRVLTRITLTADNVVALAGVVKPRVVDETRAVGVLVSKFTIFMELVLVKADWIAVVVQLFPLVKPPALVKPVPVSKYIQ